MAKRNRRPTLLAKDKHRAVSSTSKCPTSCKNSIYVIIDGFAVDAFQNPSREFSRCSALSLLLPYVAARVNVAPLTGLPNRVADAIAAVPPGFRRTTWAIAGVFIPLEAHVLTAAADFASELHLLAGEARYTERVSTRRWLRFPDVELGVHFLCPGSHALRSLLGAWRRVLPSVAFSMLRTPPSSPEVW